MSEQKESQELDKLQRKVYQRDLNIPDERSNLDPLEIDPRTKAWSSSEGAMQTAMKTQKPNKTFSVVKFIFIVSLVFFVGAVGLATFQYFNGLNVISETNIDLSIEGPEKVNAGEVLQLSVAVANRNQKDLEAVRLSAIFPSGTKEAEDPSKTLREVREPIGQISSGVAAIKTFKALVYGEEGKEQTVDFVLEYRIVGSNATFNKKETYTFVIDSSPVRITASLPEEVNSGQPLTLEVEASLNTDTVTPDMAVVVAYPPGFSFSRSEPSPTNSNNVWSLADLSAGGTKKIRIHGSVEGQDDDVKSFRVRVGTLDEPTDQDLAIEYNMLLKPVTIRRSFVALKILLGGSDTDTIIDGDKEIPIEISWANTLPVEIRNGQLEVIINGQVVREATIRPRGGNYNSDTNTITWGRNDSSLGVIGPGESGEVSFNFRTESLLTGNGVLLFNPTVDIQAKFTGARALGDNTSSSVEVEESKTLQVNTAAQFVSRGLYNAGAFAPTGPMPPRVGQETLYTIEWTILNSTNNIKEAKASAVLPVGLRWVGSISPQGEKVSYSEVNRVVTWDIGDVKAGSAIGGGRREVSFQVGLTPSVNQVGQTPVLLENIKFDGIDTFTQKVLNINTADIDIRLLKDPLFKTTTDSMVVQ